MSKKPRIIIADDMQMMRRLIKSSLIKAGFDNIEEAINGEDLMKKLDDSKYDIVICDWDMPRMSGLDALQEIRSIDRLKNIPFIMVTAVAESEQVKQAIEAGISDYIVKPVKPDVFKKKVTDLLSKNPLSTTAAG